jgi:hypothetical protein
VSVNLGGRWQTFRIVVASLALVLGIGVVDRATGLDVSVTLLYLGPVAFSAWRAGRAAGVFIAATSAAPARGQRRRTSVVR